MNPPVLVVAAAIVDDLDDPRELLAARRAVPARLAGRWEFPGGKVNPDELPEDALHREIREELGVRIALGDELVGPDDGMWLLSPEYVMRLWLAEVVDGTAEPLEEHDELRWLPVRQWFDVPWLDADVRIVDRLADRDGSGGRGQLTRGGSRFACSTDRCRGSSCTPPTTACGRLRRTSRRSARRRCTRRTSSRLVSTTSS